MKIRVIGAGLAGCEAAWAAAKAGCEVELFEMKPVRFSPAHRSENFAELVCSNSLKAARLESAAGLLKEEMRRMGSLLMDCADSCRVLREGLSRSTAVCFPPWRQNGSSKIRGSMFTAKW